MTQEEIRELAVAAGQLLSLVPASQFDQLAWELYDEIVKGRTDDEVKEIGDRLEMAGCSTVGICKKKRPQ